MFLCQKNTENQSQIWVIRRFCGPRQGRLDRGRIGRISSIHAAYEELRPSRRAGTVGKGARFVASQNLHFSVWGVWGGFVALFRAIKQGEFGPNAWLVRLGWFCRGSPSVWLFPAMACLLDVFVFRKGALRSGGSLSGAFPHDLHS